MLLRSDGFYENRCSEGHALSKGVNDTLPAFYTLSCCLKTKLTQDKFARIYYVTVISVNIGAAGDVLNLETQTQRNLLL
jgi:hypothetical protein